LLDIQDAKVNFFLMGFSIMTVTVNPTARLLELAQATLTIARALGVSEELLAATSLPAFAQGVSFHDPIIYGTEGADSLEGSESDDLIVAIQGRDVIVTGGDGNDFIAGGRGADTIDGGRGDDVIRGGKGDDSLVGGLGNDVLFGGAGNDKIYMHHNSWFQGGDVQPYVDIAFGGSGNDTIHGPQRGVDGTRTFIDGGDGDDVIYASTSGGVHVVKGGAGNDSIYTGQPGSVASFTVAGGAGNDRIFVDGGSQSVNAGGGDDVVRVNEYTLSATVNGGGGNDRLVVVEDDSLPSPAVQNGYTLNGGDGNDSIRGGRGNDTITGGAGEDVFIFNRSQDGQIDRVTDFQNGADKISFAGLGLGMEDLAFASTNYGAKITYMVDGEVNVIRLEGASLDHLDASDFIF
jgi:Ca2+-binding RTX toxin-like protein